MLRPTADADMLALVARAFSLDNKQVAQCSSQMGGGGMHRCQVAMHSHTLWGARCGPAAQYQYEYQYQCSAVQCTEKRLQFVARGSARGACTQTVVQVGVHRKVLGAAMPSPPRQRLGEG